MWMTFTIDSMDYASAQRLLPLGLLIDYSLFVYLLATYWPRRREPRVVLLLCVSLLSTIILIPRDCWARDLNKKIKFRSVLYATYIAEIVIAVDCVVLILDFADELDDAVLPDELEQDVLYVLENFNLAFVFCFRFYCLGAANGWRDILRNRRAELIAYVLFATSEVPFILLDLISELSWDAPMALYNRLTIAACLVVVARAKMRKLSDNRIHSTDGRGGTGGSNTPLAYTIASRASAAPLSVRSNSAPVATKTSKTTTAWAPKAQQ